MVRHPDSHIGAQVLVFGEVFQFDSLTGTDQYLANIDGDRDTEGEDLSVVVYDHNAIVGEGDHFAAWVAPVRPASNRPRRVAVRPRRKRRRS